MSENNKRALIFGISGQDGAYLSALLLQKKYEVHGTSRDAEMVSFANLKQLGLRDRISVSSTAMIDFRSILQTIERVQPDEIYNFSGQNSVGLSFEQPAETMESIAQGTLNILEALRTIGGHTRFYNACSGECFGDTDGVPAHENTAFEPRSPYAVAKAAARWQVSLYRQAYGVFACSGILFNHESPLRPARFVTRKVIAAATRIAAGSKERLTLGNLSIHRDWGWAPEYVEAMWRMMQLDRPEDLVIATGQANSLEEFVATAFSRLGLDWRDHVDIDKSLFRPSEIYCGVGDTARAQKVLDWRAKKSMSDVVAAMIDAEQNLMERNGPTVR
jgi:GDPmannose 4,6-dehydratase